MKTYNYKIDDISMNLIKKLKNGDADDFDLDEDLKKVNIAENELNDFANDGYRIHSVYYDLGIIIWEKEIVSNE